ncbi:MAG: hypothetical protein H7833_11560 [Magnetococcus sp. DMHC-1]|nr:hypothetical protein [Magnetococcales bacterium]
MASERGAVMLLTLTVLVMAGLSFALDALLIKSSRVREDVRAFQVLSQAKEALIAYAGASDRTNNLGRLPCPFLGNISNYDTDGTAASECNAVTGVADTVNSFGLLPWSTLGLAPLRDGSNSPILYAVAGRYKRGSSTSIPPYPAGNLTLNNNSGDYVAFVFAPGNPLSTQTRVLNDTAANQQAQFLERRAGITGDFELAKIDVNSTTPAADRYNDRVLGISQNDLIYAVTRN